MIKKEQPKEAVARWVLKYADDDYPVSYTHLSRKIS